MRSVRVEFVPQELFRALVSEVSGKNNSASLWVGMVAKDAEKAFKKNKTAIAKAVFGRMESTKFC